LPLFAEIAFPTAVRQTFTYHIPTHFQKEIETGVRVWVPFRSHFAIGVVVGIHENKPEFKTKEIKKVLDSKPILTEELLKLTEWIHRFYFCSWGEVIQAALPAGLNFVSKKRLKISSSDGLSLRTEAEKEIIDDIQNDGSITLDAAKKRYKGTSLNKVFKKLLKSGVLEIWEEPDIKVTVKTERAWDWKEGKSKKSAIEFLESQDKSFKWMEALEVFTSEEIPIRNSDADELGINNYSIKKLKDENWIRPVELEVEPDTLDLEFDPDLIKELNEEQSSVFSSIEKSIREKEFNNFLLKGITGSGKTEVYIQALKQVLESGRGGIVLVPEIALTPQTVSRFYRIFGEDIAVLHSRMNERERLDSWRKLRSGEKKIAIGPRSAIFSPVQDLGIIILDEEHDNSYKQIDPAPRYHAREVAIMRASMTDSAVIMGSATPSMQALEMTKKEKADLLELTKRHESAKLPEVEILDLKQYTGAMKGELAVPLHLAMKEALDKKEQVILLYNRRGFANYLQCETCGHIPQSPECSVSLTYHKRKNQLICHYSGYSRKADTNCEKCGSEFLSEQGSGTQKIEEQLEELFPDARVLRFDRDSTSKKGAHEKILDSFGAGKADILVGTQLVAKGLDFPNVTVVGVTDADTELAFPSFQSSERMFQLLSQVAGRSGRGTKPGKVFIQTRQPDNEALKFAQKHDYDGFADSELDFRKALTYPPYSRLVKFVLKGKNESQVRVSAFKLKSVLERLVPDFDSLGPSPAAIAWMNQYYLWEVMVKLPTDRGGNFIERLLDKVMEVYEYESEISTNIVRVNINVEAIR
jgi:primosomal protein N' (replication factor Y)